MTVNVDWAKEKADEVIAEVSQVIVGKEEFLRSMLLGFLSGGHILIEDVPGVAKTLTASMFAQVLDLDFNRIQFIPDLLPGDITGGYIYDPGRSEFTFREGPVFCNLLLADEVNRGTPKTQSALLEAMQEQQVTVEGHSFPLEKPFIVIATQNPIEFEGTYPLPEAQVDRFIMRLAIGYPGMDNEQEMLARRAARREDTATLSKLVSRDDFLKLQAVIEDIHVAPEIQRYIVEIVDATRGERRVQVGASPRGSLALFKLARSRAALAGRTFVTPLDVKTMAPAALAHRLVLKPEYWMDRISPENIVDGILEQIPTPAVKDAE